MIKGAKNRYRLPYQHTSLKPELSRVVEPQPVRYVQRHQRKQRQLLTNSKQQFRHTTCNDQQCPLKAASAKRKDSAQMQKTDSHEQRSQISVQIAISAYLTEARIVKSCQASAGTLRTTTPAETKTTPDKFQTAASACHVQ
jgi:hypothetical protein